MRGDAYGDRVDTYSFGMMLIDMAAPRGLVPFIAARWQGADPGAPAPGRGVGGGQPSENDVEALFGAIKAIWAGEWRPLEDGDCRVLPSAPPALCALAARCTRHDPRARPAFREVVAALRGEVGNPPPSPPSFSFFLFSRPRNVRPCPQVSFFTEVWPALGLIFLLETALKFRR